MSKKGFTLVEWMIVVCLLAVVFAIVVPKYIDMITPSIRIAENNSIVLHTKHSDEKLGRANIYWLLLDKQLKNGSRVANITPEQIFGIRKPGAKIHSPIEMELKDYNQLITWSKKHHLNREGKIKLTVMPQQ